MSKVAGQRRFLGIIAGQRTTPIMLCKQGGDPAKLARALVQRASGDRCLRRWVAGADAVAADIEQKAATLLAQVDAHRGLSSSLAHED
jgi:hypothetical protein